MAVLLTLALLRRVGVTSKFSMLMTGWIVWR